MPKRSVCIQNPARLYIRDNSLIVENDERYAAIPMEDIWVITLETQQVSLTSAVLSSAAKEGIGILICGDTHMPIAVQLPFASNARNAAVIEDQLLISRPLQKQLWRRVIQSKIENQALCLDYLGIEGSSKIRQFKNEVASGDTTGREAVAAAEYFKRFIADGTRREGPYTASLDYGYSIIRAGIGREAVCGGWLVSRGIHHSNNLNPYNLVDDLLEPFRPVVDLLVAKERLYDHFDKETRSKLARVFEYAVAVNHEKYSVQTAIIKELDSLRKAVIKKDALLLELPMLLPLEELEVDRR